MPASDSHPTMPIDRYVSGAYARAHPSLCDEDGPWKAARVAELLRAHGLSPRRIVDVGCGPGGVLAELLAAFPGAEGVGYDVAPEAVRRAQARYGDRDGGGRRLASRRSADVAAEPEATGFDLLLCLDVFEHVENCLDFLRRLRGRAERYVFHIPLDVNVTAVLRGRLVWAREVNGHLHYFDRATALATLADAGYEVLAWRYTRHMEQLQANHPEWDRATRAFNFVRRALYLVSPELAARLLGGYSVLALAR